MKLIKRENLRYFTLFILLLCFNAKITSAQDRFAVIESKLKSLTVDMPGLVQKVELVSVDDVTIQELIKGIAKSNSLNISIDPTLNIKIASNFTNIDVINLFIYLCKKYELDITFIGNIISIVKYNPPIVQLPKPPVKGIQVKYDSLNNSISMDLKQDTLQAVVKEITRISGKNIIFTPDIKDKPLNAFIVNAPFDNGIDKLSLSNDLQMTKTDDGFYFLEKKDATPLNDGKGGQNKKNYGNNKNNNNEEKYSFDFAAGSMDDISVSAENVPISEVIKAISTKLKLNYYLYSDLKGTVSMNVVNSSFDDILKYIFRGTDYTYKKDSSIYLIGERQLEGLRKVKVIQLQNRSTVDILNSIPADLKKNVELKEFPDLNSLVLSGSSPMITEIEHFIRDIDKVVPVILIEILVVDSKKSHSVTTGIKAGLGDKEVTTTGTLFPNIDMSLSSASINDLINSFNGFGVLNLGHVTPQFYMTLQAMEEQSLIKLRSTPKLSTLNGHEAKLTIGKTEYYLEESNNIVGGSLSTQSIITKIYKPVKADLSVTINPTVSGDDQVTLDIKVTQSDFTGIKISPQAPPGQISRDFSSLIRIKNGEMVLLGGLEEVSSSNTGSGVPLLSRIPVIKWLFSSRKQDKSKSKLNIFIKPTVIY